MSLLNWILSRRKDGAAAERRLWPRKATRLRPGKLLGKDKAFVADCAILDRSESGMRIKVFGEPEALEGAVSVFDENEGTTVEAKIAWKRQPDIGLRLSSLPEPLGEEDLRRLSGPYYAVRE